MNGILDDMELEGLVPRIVKEVFHNIENGSSDIDWEVKVSILEIYMEKIKDLLDPTRENLNVREDKQKGLYIENLSEQYVTNKDEVLTAMRIGNDNRSIAFTKMNATSSRSHLIVIISIHQSNMLTFCL